VRLTVLRKEEPHQADEQPQVTSPHNERNSIYIFYLILMLFKAFK
jgi:hypothetical protein